jgi:hypothetical protein
VLSFTVKELFDLLMASAIQSGVRGAYAQRRKPPAAMILIIEIRAEGRNTFIQPQLAKALASMPMGRQFFYSALETSSGFSCM